MSEIAILPMNWRPVVADVCRRHRVGVLNILKRSQRQRIVRCRFEIWREIRERFGSSFHEIGRRFGYNHASVMYGVRHARERDSTVAETRHSIERKSA